MRRVLGLILALALLGLLPAAADASIRGKIINDCADDGILQGHYTPSQLRDARKHLPSDVAEYSDCADVLRRAELPDGGDSGNGGGSGIGTTAPPTGGTAPAPVATPPLTAQTPQDQAALDSSAQAPDRPVTVGGENLLAGAKPLREGYRANGLPDSLIIALILLALAGVALSFPPVRRKLPGLRLPRIRRPAS